MWVNEILFVLMAVALIAMMVLALVVKVNSRNRVSPPQSEGVDKPVAEPRIEVKRKPSKLVVETIREPEPLPTTIALQGEPVHEEEPALEQFPVLVSELDIVDSPEEKQPIIEPPEEPIPEPKVEPIILVPTLEPSNPPVIERHEPAPVEADLRRETESKFFDLRYDLSPQSVAKDEPDIMNGSPVVEYEEKEEEPLPGVVVCPHCKSSVPQTLYCIYCGNTLTAKPSAAKQS
jgi:hypothetical protein